MSDNTTIDGASLDAAVQMFSPQIMHILADVSRVINGLIGLLIMVALILLFLHLIRWAVCGSASTAGRASIAGAIRTFIAIFLMVDIWAIMRLLQRIGDISPAVAYLIVVCAAVLLGAWSFLGIGNLLVDSLIRGVQSFVDFSIAHIRALRHQARFVKFLQKRSDAVLRFIVLIPMVFAVSVLSLFWQFTGQGAIARPVVFKDSGPISETIGALPLTREEGDVEINGTTYINRHYGISITYPEGWELEESTSSNSLLVAYKPDEALYSAVNAGIFEDTTDGSDEAFLTAVWRVQKFVFGSFTDQSAGVLNSETTTFPDISYSSSSRIAMQSFWKFEGDRIDRVRDTYLVFRNNPVFFTLQVKAWGETTDDEYTQAIRDISDSITLTPLR